MAFVFDDNFAIDVLNYLGLGEGNPFLTPNALYDDSLLKSEVEFYINNMLDYDSFTSDIQAFIMLAAKQILAGRIALNKLAVVIPKSMSDDSTSFKMHKIDFVGLGERLINQGEAIIHTITGTDSDSPAFLVTNPFDAITGE